MSFLKGFAEGFLTTSAETMKTNNEAKKQDDLLRAKSLYDLDADKQLLDHKTKKELEIESAKSAATKAFFLEQGLGDIMTPTSGAGVSAVATPKATDITKLYGALEAAQTVGNDKAATIIKTRIDAFNDINKLGKADDERARQATLTSEGTNFAPELAKKEEKRLSEAKVVSRFGLNEGRAIIAGSEVGAALIEKEKAGSAALVDAATEIMAQSAATGSKVSPAVGTRIEKSLEEATALAIQASADPAPSADQMEQLHNQYILKLNDISEQAGIDAEAILEQSLQRSGLVAPMPIGRVQPASPQEQDAAIAGEPVTKPKKAMTLQEYMQWRKSQQQ